MVLQIVSKWKEYTESDLQTLGNHSWKRISYGEKDYQIPGDEDEENADARVVSTFAYEIPNVGCIVRVVSFVLGLEHGVATVRSESTGEPVYIPGVRLAASGSLDKETLYVLEAIPSP